MKQNNPLTVEIAGGLGNQLFMFYAGLYFQENLQRKVTFDISDLLRIKKLHPGENIQTLGLLDGYSTTDGFKTLNKKMEKAVSGLKRFATKDPHGSTFTTKEIGFINSDLIASSFNRISGYFQTWIYFDSLKNRPILSLESISNPSTWLIENLQRAERENVLSLHVRRGDYALQTNRMNGILSVEYFRKALMSFSECDCVWIFTDSPKEVEHEFLQLGFPFEIVCPPSNSDPVESLILMAASKNIVISNSTYSWWSAMLAGDEASIFAPSKWYELREDPIKLIPDTWSRIPSDWATQ